MVWSWNVIFRKSQKLLTERALSELYGGGLFIKFNSYSFNFNGGLRKHRVGYCLLWSPSPRGKQFLQFLKTDLLRFHRIYLLFDWIKLLFFYMCLLRINFPNLCPNMNHFFWCSGFQWMSLWRSGKFLLTLSKLSVKRNLSLLDMHNILYKLNYEP